MPKKIIAIVGATASGKTALAVELAKELSGEVVSCDSMQIYKGMDIGTAKPTSEEKCEIPHHMIDILAPQNRFSVADFVKLARETIGDIQSRGKVPILAGGTGLYMDSVLFNIEFLDFECDGIFKAKMEELLKLKGKTALHDELKKRDIEAAEKIHPNNTRRVMRAIEVCEATGKTFSEVSREAKKTPLYDALVLGLDVGREKLYEKIDKRVDIMIEDGLLDEVKALKKSGIKRDTTAIQAIGYKELYDYFDGLCSLNEAIDKIKQESRRYAKRQLTWFKRNKDINWIDLTQNGSKEMALKKCKDFLRED